MSSKSFSPLLLALFVSTTSLSHPLTWRPASAQSLPPPPPIGSVKVAQAAVIPAGTPIPVRFQKAQKILVTREETLPLALTVAADISDQNGQVGIPAGSQIIGQIEPAGQGARFVARELRLPNRKRIPLSATSAVVIRTETIQEGASAGEILGGTLAGAGAATLIAGLTGDRRIEALEVLAGAAVGALAGWALPAAGVLGGGSQELLAIDPNRDLTLTVQSDLFLESRRGNGYSRLGLSRW